MPSCSIIVIMAILAGVIADPPANNEYSEEWWTKFANTFNTTEIELIYNRLSGTYFQSEFTPSGDVQCDGNLNILDIVQTVNIILSSGNSTHCAWQLNDDQFFERVCGPVKTWECNTNINTSISCTCVS